MALSSLSYAIRGNSLIKTPLEVKLIIKNNIPRKIAYKDIVLDFSIFIALAYAYTNTIQQVF